MPLQAPFFLGQAVSRDSDGTPAVLAAIVLEFVVIRQASDVYPIWTDELYRSWSFAPPQRIALPLTPSWIVPGLLVKNPVEPTPFRVQAVDQVYGIVTIFRRVGRETSWISLESFLARFPKPT